MKTPGLKYAVLLITFVVVLDFVLGKIYQKFFFSNNSIKNDPLIHAVLGTTEEILIFGSSRAKHHYNPQLISDSLGMSCFNVGAGGQNIYYHLALLESILEHHRPQIVIYELMSIDFEKTPPQWDTEKLGELLPFYHRSTAIKNTLVEKRGQVERFKTLSNIYPFNSTQYVAIRNNFRPYQNHINGYIPLHKTWTKRIEKETLSPIESDPEKIKALFRFIDISQHNNIKLFIFVSPVFVEFQGASRYEEISLQIRKNYGIEVYNFEHTPHFLQHPHFFADPLHLNQEGATEYTKLIIDSLLKPKIKN